MRLSAVDILFESLRPSARFAPDVLTRCWMHLDVTRILILLEIEDASAWLGVCAAAAGVGLPHAVADAVRGAQRDAIVRRLMVEAEVARAAGALCAAGIDVALIKGSARPYLADDALLLARRPLDVDLLVEPGALDRSVRTLAAAGYKDAGHDVPAGHFHARAMTAGSMFVELHSSLSHAVTPEASWSSLAADGRRVQLPSAEVWVPTLAESAWHVALHQANSGISWRRFRHIADAAALLRLLPSTELDRFFVRLAAAGGEAGRPDIDWWRRVAEFAGVSISGLHVAERAESLDTALHWEFFALRSAGWLGGRIHESATLAPYRSDYKRVGESLPRRRSSLTRRALNNATEAVWKCFAWRRSIRYSPSDTVKQYG